MSRIGKKPVIIPEGVRIEQKDRSIKVTGPLGTLQMDIRQPISVKVDAAAGWILVENESPEMRQAKQLHGTTRALIANMVTGVNKGFEKKMEIYGTGYGIKAEGARLVLQVGFSHPVEMPVPEGIKLKIETAVTRGNEVPAKFTLSGIDKCLLGQFAAEVRKVKPPEPYKGKGIRYAEEYVRRKAGKAVTSGAA